MEIRSSSASFLACLEDRIRMNVEREGRYM